MVSPKSKSVVDKSIVDDLLNDVREKYNRLENFIIEEMEKRHEDSFSIRLEVIKSAYDKLDYETLGEILDNLGFNISEMGVTERDVDFYGDEILEEALSDVVDELNYYLRDFEFEIPGNFGYEWDDGNLYLTFYVDLYELRYIMDEE